MQLKDHGKRRSMITMGLVVSLVAVSSLMFLPGAGATPPEQKPQPTPSIPENVKVIQVPMPDDAHVKRLEMPDDSQIKRVPMPDDSQVKRLKMPDDTQIKRVPMPAVTKP